MNSEVSSSQSPNPSSSASRASFDISIESVFDLFPHPIEDGFGLFPRAGQVACDLSGRFLDHTVITFNIGAWSEVLAQVARHALGHPQSVRILGGKRVMFDDFQRDQRERGLARGKTRDGDLHLLDAIVEHAVAERSYMGGKVFAEDPHRLLRPGHRDGHRGRHAGHRPASLDLHSDPPTLRARIGQPDRGFADGFGGRKRQGYGQHQQQAPRRNAGR